MKRLLRPSLQWLLVFFPVALWAEHSRPDEHVLIFASACIAIIPLAGLLGLATEHISARAGEGLGGFLNATFGNAAELIIAIVALRGGQFEVVKASITGSIIGNVLLVLGAAFVAGGLRHSQQRFNAAGAHAQAVTLTIAAVALIMLAAFHGLGPEKATPELEQGLSLAVSVVLLGVYFLGLLFSLRTHRNLFTSGHTVEDLDDGDLGGAPWSVRRSIACIVVASALIAWMSEVLVGSVEGAVETLGMSEVFVGVIIVAIVGNAAEHSTAILVALRNRMDLSVGIAVGSSAQIALFVAPLLVCLSYFTAPQPMDLVFTQGELLAVVLAAVITSEAVRNGESNWFEGVQLLAVYAILALAFYFLPA